MTNTATAHPGHGTHDTTTSAPRPRLADLCPDVIGQPGIYRGITRDAVYVSLNDGRYAVCNPGSQPGRAGNVLIYVTASSDAELAAALRGMVQAEQERLAAACQAEIDRYAALPLNHIERQINWLHAIIARDDSAFGAQAVEWLGLDLAEAWESLDNDERDWLVESGIVAEVGAAVACDDAESWKDVWCSDSGAAWPTYSLSITAEDGGCVIEVDGWHLVRPMGPDGNRQHTEWATEDCDKSGLPRLDNWEIEAGDNMSGGGLIPCWRNDDDQWCTLDRDKLDDAIAAAASAADHGGDPDWTDVDRDDMECYEILYIIRNHEIVEVSLLSGGIAGHDVEVVNYDEYGDYRPRSETHYYATAWSTDQTEDTYESKGAALAAIRDLADDKKVWCSDDHAKSALARIAYDARDTPEGMDCGVDDSGLYVQPVVDGDDARYHLDADQCTRVIRYGWSAVMPDIVEALGVRTTLDGARQWQHDMDKVIAEQDPWVQIDDSLAAGNCREETDRFYRRLCDELGGEGIGAVRASVILRLRDDSYTRRTCRVAASRLFA